MSAAILTEVMTLSASAISSLLTHSVQEKVSPTYALPKAGGRVSWLMVSSQSETPWISREITIGFNMKSVSPSSKCPDKSPAWLLSISDAEET